MLDIKKIADLPMCARAQEIIDKVRSYPFYVLYGLGYACEFSFHNYVSHFGKPRFIVDKAKGGRTYEGVPVVSSLDEVIDKNYCIVISAPTYAEEIIKLCRECVPNDAIIPCAGELMFTHSSYPKFLVSNKSSLMNFYNQLADDASRHILEVWLTGRVTKDVNLFYSICTPNSYMNASFLTEDLQRFVGYDEIIPVNFDRTRPSDCYFITGLFDLPDDSVFYDIGAAYGDTIAGFFEYGNKNAKAVAVELDPQVASKLAAFCQDHGYDVLVENCGVAEAEGELALERGNTGGTSINASRNVYGGGTDILRITTIDNLVQETHLIPTMIKMDIEGAELSALKGASETIKQHKPKLAICVYHKPEDIIEIPNYILSLRPDYKLHLRHFSTAEAELVLFAV